MPWTHAPSQEKLPHHSWKVLKSSPHSLQLEKAHKLELSGENEIRGGFLLKDPKPFGFLEQVSLLGSL